MDKKARILTGESGSSHGMALIAVDTDANGKPTKWQFENSWGPESDYKGYLTFTDDCSTNICSGLSSTKSIWTKKR
jgi:bleomycin hydrolase